MDITYITLLMIAAAVAIQSSASTAMYFLISSWIKILLVNIALILGFVGIHYVILVR